MSGFNRGFDWHAALLKVMVGVAALGFCWLLYMVWYEATFDYTVCDGTDQYREQHSAAYVTYNKVGDISIPVHHPARDWTERLYKCPDGDGRGKRFDKWRTENQP